MYLVPDIFLVVVEMAVDCLVINMVKFSLKTNAMKTNETQYLVLKMYFLRRLLVNHTTSEFQLVSTNTHSETFFVLHMVFLPDH